MNIKFSRLLAVLLVAVLSLSLVACGGTPEEPVDPDVSTTTADTADTTEGNVDTDPTDAVEGETEDTTAADGETEDTTTAGDNTPANTTKGEAANTTKGDKTTVKNPATTAGKNTTTGKGTTTAPQKKPGAGITTTKATTTTAATTSAPKNPLRVLSIGHSFSKDAMEKYLWDLLYNTGEYDYLVIAYLYYPGCSLDRQWYNISGADDKGSATDKDGKKYEYEQYRKTDPYTGEWQTMYKPDRYKNKAAHAIADEKWDIVTLQPSPDYGAGPEKCGSNNNDYDHVGDLVDFIQKGAPTAQIYYHMTWAFATDCKLWSFMYSNFDQMTMYKDFVNATKKYIFAAHPEFKKIIPAGTSIQNARSSKLGDVFNMPGNYDPNADGYHLNDRGDFVAALTWYSVLTGKSAKTAVCPSEWKDDFNIYSEAVDNAVKTPYSVTESSYK